MRDRRPMEVPHHPKVLLVGAIISAACLAFMGAWFWNIMTSPGLLPLTEEQQRAAEEDELDSNLSSSDRAREQEAAQAQPTDAPPGKAGKDTGPPEAPDASDTTTDQLELSEWSILSVNGILQIGGTLMNTSSEPLSGTVKAFVYYDRVPIATAKTEIQNLQPGEDERVNMVSDSDWEPGTPKVVLLEFTPSTK